VDEGRRIEAEVSSLTAHWRTLFENKYLGAWNLFVNGKYSTVTVTIDRAVQEQTVMEGGRKSLALLLYFAGKRTPMILTKKMGKAISAMHGPSPAGWVGKQITLYVDQGFPTRDGPADVLRIRNTQAGTGLRQRLQQKPPEDDGAPPETPPDLEQFGGDDDA
jgi:hypothetical protein